MIRIFSLKRSYKLSKILNLCFCIMEKRYCMNIFRFVFYDSADVFLKGNNWENSDAKDLLSSQR